MTKVLPFPLNPRVAAMLDALPACPEKDFLKELMKYEIERHSGERADKPYKEDILKLVEKYAMKTEGKT